MASKYAGYMGKVMMVDLTTETVTEYPWTDEQRELYLGGKIMAARILCDHLTGKETAFSEENWVVIATGPLTGTGAPSSARFDISALSPQTGILASSNCGGSFGFHLKKAGYDALILKGKCRSHRWLEINDGAFLFHDADELWGLKVGPCQERLAELVGKKRFGKLCIGPAGENLVKYAGVISDERAAGRTGMGAVLGWKNLKAITASGTKTIPIHDKEKTAAWCKKWIEYLQKHPLTGEQLPRMGTAGLVSSMQMIGILSTKNYSAGRFEDFEKVSGELLAEGSKRLSEKYGGKEFAIHSKGLELAAYEPRRAVGQGLGYAVSNRGGCHLNGGYMVIMEGLGLHMDSQTPKAKADLTMTFQDLMETISASGQCLFTSYAFFPGFLLTKPNGIVTKTVNAAAPHIGWAVRLINKCPRIAALHLPIFQHTKMIELALGMKMDFGRYIEIGERGYTMERYINTKFGISAANDKLPKRLTDVPQDPGNPKTKVPLETMKKTYYQARGWDHNGIPTEKLLRRLKIK